MKNQNCGIYVLIDPRDKLVHYVGQSKNLWNRKALHERCGTNPEQLQWRLEVAKAGLEVRMKVRLFCHQSELVFWEAFFLTEEIRNGSPIKNSHKSRAMKLAVSLIKREVPSSLKIPESALQIRPRQGEIQRGYQFEN